MKISTAIQISYWLIWIVGVFYSIIVFCMEIYNKQYLLNPLDFEDGWKILHRKKDVSDVEWSSITCAFKKYWFILLIHSSIFHFGLAQKREFIPGFHFCYSLCSLYYIGGLIVCVEYLGYILIILTAVNLFMNKVFCYIITLMTLFFTQMKPISKINENFVPGTEESFLTEVGFIWLLARCLSFSVDWINANKTQKMKVKDIILIFSYCLYLPVIFTGPLICYSSFESQINRKKVTLTYNWKLLYPFIRLLGCYIILEVFLHFVYSSATQFYPDIVIEFNSWALGGLGYALPTLFFLKYSVLYGLPYAIAGLEGMELPTPPSCISCIHRPSLLWKSFDPGLYKWLYRYIYRPIFKYSRVLALAFSFSFVCLWHGMGSAIITWTVLNFINAILEKSIVFKIIESFSLTDKSIKLKLLIALVSFPLFMIMCLSSCFFLTNWEIGMLVFKRTLCNGIIPLLPASLIMFCGCCVGEDVYEYKLRHKDSTKILSPF